MYCHAGPSSFTFLAGCQILTNADLQIQISKRWVAAETEATSAVENCNVSQS